MSERADSLERRRAVAYLVLSIIGISAVILGICYLLGRVSLAVGTACLSAFFVFAFHRLVDWLEVRHIPRGWAVIICYLLLFGVLALIIVGIGPALKTQIVAFLDAIPDYVRRLTSWTQGLWAQYGYLLDNADMRSAVDSLGGSVTSWASSAASRLGSNIVSSVTSFVTSIAIVFMALVAAFWFLVDYHRIAHEFRVVVGPRHQDGVAAVMSICSRCIGGYCKGVLLASCCTGVIAGLGFALVGEPYPVALGFLTGVMNVIPVIGPWIAGMVAAVIGLSTNVWVGLLSILITVCAQQFTDTFITPRIMSSTVQLHPGLVVIALAAGASVGGVLGMIIAVPLVAAAKAIYVYFFERRSGRQLASSDGAFFKGAPVQAPSDGPAQADAVDVDGPPDEPDPDSDQTQQL